MSGRWRRALAALALAAMAGGAVALAQRGGVGGGFRGLRGGIPVAPNIPYDGRFTFVRLRYGPPTDFVSQRLMWSHDYPIGEQHFMKILNELSYLNPHTAETNILGIGDPELFKYPVAYLCEPGRAFDMTDEEAANLRDYLHKGGFLIVDDFRYEDWGYFEAQMRRVLPSAQFQDIDQTHPIFNSFFAIKQLEVPQMYDQGPPIFRAIFEDNDPRKRIMVMINYNTDISEYWEFSDTGFLPIDESNEAYKIGVNYVIYGMTH
ncbi:MAG: DUF4159 domain-containing protein [Acidobacteria bacterium]|nr:DUF4159 domain-containing protein [Acidobacteriota bacterium]